MPFETGRVVYSLKGHDSVSLMVCVGTRGDRILVCNGKQRLKEKPKEKNIKHITPTHIILSEEQLRTDRQIRRALREIISSQKGDELNV